MQTELAQLNTRFDELIVFLSGQFAHIERNMATKVDLKNLAAELRAESAELRAELRAEMVTKAEFYAEIRPMKDDIIEIKDIVRRLDRRHLAKQGHKI